MRKVLYLSSWRLFHKGRVEVPFIFEQIGLLSEIVRASYADLTFTGLFRWFYLFLSGKWFVSSNSDIWGEQGYKVTHFNICLPRLSTRLTGNPLWRDCYWAGRLLAPIISRKVGGIDAIHTHVVLPSGAFAVAFKERLGIPFVLQEHSGPFEMHCRTEQNTEGVKFVLDQASVVVPVSKSLADIMRRYTANVASRIRIVPNLLRTDIFKPYRSKDRKSAVPTSVRVISVCSAQKVKRHDLMFRVIKDLAGQGFDVSLTIYGIDDSNRELTQLRDSLGLNSIIDFKGRTSREAIFRAFDSHDVYLCTSDTETFGLAPAEALCSGLPVVSSDCGGVNEFLKFRHTRIVSGQDPHRYAEAIIEVLHVWDGVDKMKIWNDMNVRYGKGSFRNEIASIYERFQFERN